MTPFRSNQPRLPGHLFLAGLVFMVMSTSVAVADPPCPPLPASPASRYKPAVKPSKTDDRPTYVTADEIRSIKGGLSEFIGHVELRRGEEQIAADRIVYDKQTDTAEATGSVRFDSASGDHYETESLWMQVKPRIGHTAESRFRIDSSQGRGDAARIEFAGPDRTLLTGARYTTCPVAQDDWFLNVRELEIDNAEEIGTARHAWIEFKNVPVFYFPYMNFPITDKRKSGFLIPQFGNDDRRGLMVAVPYYFNLATNHDATLTPQIMSRRGLMLQGEYRYLGKSGHGKLGAEMLLNDAVADRDRDAVTLTLDQVLSPGWGAHAEIRHVSDNEYFKDFGDNIGITSQTHLPQIAQVSFTGAVWTFSTLLAGYQTIDPLIAPSDRPYARLPQINLIARPDGMANTPQLHLATEWVNFTRDTGLTGKRISAAPAVSLPLATGYGFLTPRLGARHIAYNLNDAADDAPSLTTTSASLDGGLIFERNTTFGGSAFTQTLEPRLFYLRVPYKNQDALPNFDSAAANFSFASLFLENRFAGGDRVGDANQLTAAVTTRFIDGTNGAERLRLSLGQTRYFEDRLVNLPAGTADRETSDYAAEVAARLAGNWFVHGALQWNPETEQSEKRSYYAQYQPAPNKILTFGHRFVRDEVDQADIATEWPLTTYWTLHARSLYSIKDARNMESYVGAEYGTCCWAFRLFVRQRYAETRDEFDNVTGGRQVNSIQFQLELTGLSKLGSAPTSPLRDGLFYPWRGRELDSSLQ